tara:strand:+ start:335 stop:550 length:216 start_codon:yes stop_codon:yes gene_type:complete
MIDKELRVEIIDRTNEFFLDNGKCLNDKVYLCEWYDSFVYGDTPEEVLKKMLKINSVNIEKILDFLDEQGY